MDEIEKSMWGIPKSNKTIKMEQRIRDLTFALSELLEASEEYEQIGLADAQAKAHILLNDPNWRE